MTPITALGSRYGIQGALGRSVKRAAVSSGGWWDLDGTITSCVAAYQPKGAASYAASLVNLANPGTYNADDEGTHAPDWSSAGWAQNTGAYLLTGLTISSASNWSIIMRHDNWSTSNYYSSMFGLMQWENEYALYGRYNDPSAKIGNATSGNSNKWITGTNYIALTPTYHYTNGTCTAHGLTYSGFSNNLKIGASYALSSVYYFLGTISAVSVYNADLTSTQLSDLATAMAAL